MEDEDNWDEPFIEVRKEPGKLKACSIYANFDLETSFNTKSGNVLEDFEKIKKRVALG